jgi:UPF0271 protein
LTEELYILDTRAVSSGLAIPSVEMYTTSSVINEVKRGSRWDEIQELRLKASNIAVVDPDQRWLNEAKECVERTGDYTAISDTDLSIIALALQLSSERQRKVIVLSDDYSVMNVCKNAGIEVKPIMFQGISKTKIWQWYCPACGYQPKAGWESGPCIACGAKLKRRPKVRFEGTP